jgi:hypothetical protein
MSILAFPESITVTPALHAEVLTITPEMAEQFLAKNTHNRNPKSSNLKKVVRALSNGEWKLNGEAIKIATSGAILDGQHRLLAIVQTGIPMTTLVIRGLESDTQETMDGGSPRTAADALKLRGEANFTTLAAVAKKICTYNAAGLRAATGTSFTITTAEILAAADSTPGIRDTARYANNIAAGTGMTASIVGLLFHIFSAIDADDATFFFDRFHDGEMLAKGNPIYELRRTLENVKSVRGEKSQTFIAAVTIKAWNKFREGESVALLKFTAGGATPEKFPEPK